MQTLPSLDCCESLKLACQNFAKCSGRSRRSEFWYLYLTLFIINTILFATIFSLTLNTKSSTHSIYIIYFCSLVLFIPLIAAGIRRLHDTGRTGAFIFLLIVPFGIFCLLYMWSIDSEERSNEYGPSPKYILPNIPSQQPINPYPQQNMPSVYPYPNNPIPPQGYTVDPNVPNNVYAQPAYIPPQTGGYQQPYP